MSVTRRLVAFAVSFMATELAAQPASPAPGTPGAVGSIGGGNVPDPPSDPLLDWDPRDGPPPGMDLRGLPWLYHPVPPATLLQGRTITKTRGGGPDAYHFQYTALAIDVDGDRITAVADYSGMSRSCQLYSFCVAYVIGEAEAALLFRVDEDSGLIRPVQCVNAGGIEPREAQHAALMAAAEQFGDSLFLSDPPRMCWDVSDAEYRVEPLEHDE